MSRRSFTSRTFVLLEVKQKICFEEQKCFTRKTFGSITFGFIRGKTCLPAEHLVLLEVKCFTSRTFGRRLRDSMVGSWLVALVLK